MRSDMIKMGIDRAPARGLLYATGQVKSAKDMQKPFIAICNSYIDIVPYFQVWMKAQQNQAENFQEP